MIYLIGWGLIVAWVVGNLLFYWMNKKNDFLENAIFGGFLFAFFYGLFGTLACLAFADVANSHNGTTYVVSSHEVRDFNPNDDEAVYVKQEGSYYTFYRARGDDFVLDEVLHGDVDVVESEGVKPKFVTIGKRHKSLFWPTETNKEDYAYELVVPPGSVD